MDHPIETADGLGDLMRLAQDGDRVAYRRLLTQVAPLLRQWLKRRFLPDPEVEDIVQDVLLSVHAARATYDWRRPFLPWLMAIARNRAADAARRHGRRKAREVAVEQYPETSEDQATNMIEKVYGDQLRSVVLYGSAAAGEHIPKKSDYNVLVIVDALPLERLRAVAAVSQAWAEDGNPPPMTFTLNEWTSSSDIFPMEYADILERHRVLYGAPPFDGIRVSPADLRLQVEHQTMGKLLQLRQATMGAGGDTRKQLGVLENSRAQHVDGDLSWCVPVVRTRAVAGLRRADALARAADGVFSGAVRESHSSRARGRKNSARERRWYSGGISGGDGAAGGISQRIQLRVRPSLFEKEAPHGRITLPETETASECCQFFTERIRK